MNRERELAPELRRALESVFGDRAAAFRWMDSPIPAFNGATPAMMVADGRTDEVVQLLREVDLGYMG